MKSSCKCLPGIAISLSEVCDGELCAYTLGRSWGKELKRVSEKVRMNYKNMLQDSQYFISL